MPNRKSGASWPNRSIASSYVIRGSGSFKSMPSSCFASRAISPSIDADDVFRIDERHLDVELRELRLPIGPQVLVAEAAGDLHVAIVARHHQDLLVELRRLGQGVERAVVHAAGHQVVAGTFRRAAAEDRRLDVDEAEVAKIVAHAADHAIAQEQRPLHVLPAEVEIAVFKPQLFVGQVLAKCARRDGRRDALVEQLEIGDPQLDLARRMLGIGHAGGPTGDDARDLDHVLGPQRLALVDDRRRRVGRIEDDLRDAVAIAEIDEQAAAMVAVAIDPATEGDRLADVFDAKFATGMSTQHAMILSQRNDNLGKPAIVIATATSD